MPARPPSARRATSRSPPRTWRPPCAAPLPREPAWLGAQPVARGVEASGLEAGEGVVVAAAVDGAPAAVEAMVAGRGGGAGHEVVIEEFLSGEAAPFIVRADGADVLPLAASQD